MVEYTPIQIINWTRSFDPDEVWCLRISNVSRRSNTQYFPLTKTAFRYIHTPQEQLIEEMFTMVVERAEKLYGKEQIDAGSSVSPVEWSVFTTPIPRGGGGGGLLNLSELRQKNWIYHLWDYKRNDPLNFMLVMTASNDLGWYWKVYETDTLEKLKESKEIAFRGRHEEPNKALYVKCVRVKVK